jgi:hypothetical protein
MQAHRACIFLNDKMGQTPTRPGTQVILKAVKMRVFAAGGYREI